MAQQDRRFAVALSFPGEHRDFVRSVAEHLENHFGRDRVFFDEWHEAFLWGVKGDVKLRSVYRDQSELVVPFFSSFYSKPWCELEWSAIREILLERRGEDSVIPIALDDTQIDGWGKNDFAARVRNRTPAEISELIVSAYNFRRPQNPALEPIAPRPSLDLETSLLQMMDPDEGKNQAGFESLMSYGAAGEDFFLRSLHSIERDCISELRCLHYVWRRRESIASKLVNVLEKGSQSVRSMAAFLCQGLGCDSNARDEAFQLVHRNFIGVPNSSLSPGQSWWAAYDDLSLMHFMEAYGHLGGSASWLCDWAQASSSAWEKTSTWSFRSACSSYALTGVGWSHIKRLIRPAAKRSVYEDPFPPIPTTELWHAAYFGPFANWVRRDVVDELATEWQRDSSPEIRLFAAMIVGSHGPMRLESLIREWNEHEDDAQVRSVLISQLFDRDMQNARGAFENAVREAKSGKPQDRECVVWLARRAVTAPNIDELLRSNDWYSRSCGLVALALLDRTYAAKLAHDMLAEATDPLEKLLSTVSLAICTAHEGKALITRALTEACTYRHSGWNRLNMRYLNRLWRVVLSEAIERILGTQSFWLQLLRPIKLI